MGQDYSYTQLSSSDEYDLASLLLAEAQCYVDEAENSYNGAEQVQYPLQPEVGDGILRTCNCGGDVAVMEEMSDLKRQHRELKDHIYENDQKLVTVEKSVGELSKKNSGVTNGWALAVSLMVCLLVLIALAFMFLTGRASKD